MFLNSVDRVQSRVSPWFPETGPLTEPGAHWFLARLASQQSTTTLLSLRPSAGVTGIHGFVGGYWRSDHTASCTQQQALLSTEFAFVFCFWVLIVAVGMLLASSFGTTRTHCGTEDRGGPSVAANNKHLNSVSAPCPFKVLTHDIPKMACGPLKEAKGLGCPQPSFPTDTQ